ncbi:MAG: SRPBCC family protein [Acidobacteria bacterium]|nr:SRPBCC family protein [Acidobacteriota bacterium]
MKVIVLYIAGVISAVVALAYAAGCMIPEEHSVSITADYSAAAEKLYAVISDATKFMEWRSGLKSVEVKDGVITEVSSHGTMSYRFSEQVPARKLVTADTGGREKGWTGSWTFEIEPAGGGSRLTITERGRVFSPLFRVMSKLFFSYEDTARNYHADLARRLAR